jgi:predicted SPOUT superfamily RNA methylase MTH1
MYLSCPLFDFLVGYIVSPREPTQEQGLYWGYHTRLCNSLSEAISAPCWNEPYDLVIGTSERGSSLTDVIRATQSGAAIGPGEASALPLHPFNHALIVFGSLSGLEVAIERDPNINLTADDASELFDSWLNVVEGQGSRTIRTEVSAIMLYCYKLNFTTLTIFAFDRKRF